MPGEINEVIQLLRRAALRQDESGVMDGQLLGRLIERRGHAAVTVLAQRHGPGSSG